MLQGKRVLLRPVKEEDWPLLEGWGQSRDRLWGPFQRFQLDHLPQLRQAFVATGLMRREGGFLLVELLESRKAIGFVRYTLAVLPDADYPTPEIGYGIAEPGERGKGYAGEAVGLLVDYLWSGYAVERLSAFTDVDNLASRRVLERLGFRQEGVLQRAMFRDGAWRDVTVYGLLRSDER